VAKQDAEETRLRQDVLSAALAMSAMGLSPGRSGNVSARFKKGMIITPSGLPYDSLTPSSMVRLRPSGKPAADQLKPSSEWLFQLAIYRARPDVGAIVHCHSLNATALACAEKSIPAFHYMVAVAGGADIPLAPYATFGSEDLARAAAAALARRNACLLAHHGQIAAGANLEAALDLAHEVESLAAQYIKVLTLGPAPLLDAEEMERVLVKFASYGRAAQGRD
jgi:L-fuculose-phosphate aldolase